MILLLFLMRIVRGKFECSKITEKLAPISSKKLSENWIKDNNKTANSSGMTSILFKISRFYEELFVENDKCPILGDQMLNLWFEVVVDNERRL